MMMQKTTFAMSSGVRMLIRIQLQRGLSSSASSVHDDDAILTAKFKKLYRHLLESEASGELLGCIVSNLWDLEAILSGNDNPTTLTTTIPEIINANQLVHQVVDILRLSPLASRMHKVILRVRSSHFPTPRLTSGSTRCTQESARSHCTRPRAPSPLTGDRGSDGATKAER